ncbi:hypothetical protein ACTXT7_001156 [Hymenolepis weldensis]
MTCSTKLSSAMMRLNIIRATAKEPLRKQQNNTAHPSELSWEVIILPLIELYPCEVHNVTKAD